MDKELSDALDPPLLLHLFSLEADPRVSRLIGEVCAATTVKNLYYFDDVIKTWKKHAEPTDGADGALLSETNGEIKWVYADLAISKMESHMLPDLSEVHTLRLLKILVCFAEKCTFGRLGDTFVKDAICAKLSPGLFASIGDTEAPYAKSKAHFGDSMNDVVNMLIRTPPAERMKVTSWKTSRESTDFIFAACLLLEMMGQEKLSKILKNHELAVHRYSKSELPHLCVLKGEMCMLWGETLFYVSESVVYPTIALCVHWVRCAALMGDVSARSVQCAIQTPSKLSARDPIYSFVK